MPARRVHARSSLAFTLLLLAAASAASGAQGFRVDTLAHGLRQPTALAFLPDGRAILSERPVSVLSLVDLTAGTLTPLEGAPKALLASGDEEPGIHDVELHPDYAENGWIYVAYTEGDTARSTTVVDRMRLRGTRLVDTERVFTANAWSEIRYHYGGRLAFLDGHLFVTVGDRHHQERAQERTSHAGTIVRLRDDGGVPGDNPFVGEADVPPEIWSYGHRNPQGLAVHPETGELWAHEHGPRHGDELNVIRRGADYGWPTISYGWEYAGGPIGTGIPAHEGMEPAVWVWTPTIAPSGLVSYTGDAFPEWRGSLFSGAMASARPHLNRLVLRDGRGVLEERLLLDQVGRVRLVAQGPDGFLYLGSDSGQLLRVRPSD